MVVMEVETDMKCRNAQREALSMNELLMLLQEALVLLKNVLLKIGLPHRKGPHLIHKLLKSNLFRGWRLQRR